MPIKDAVLREYAELLAKNGFTIYEPKGVWEYFVYSRMVDGRECFGSVQRGGALEGYQHHMPIKPSKEHGSSMFVEDVPDELTIEAATAVASPRNYNKLVGSHENYRDDRFLESGYVRWGADTVSENTNPE
jgi:hypothetical protein